MRFFSAPREERALGLRLNRGKARGALLSWRGWDVSSGSKGQGPGFSFQVD